MLVFCNYLHIFLYKTAVADNNKSFQGFVIIFTYIYTQFYHISQP